MAITQGKNEINPYGYDIKSLVLVGENGEIDLTYLMVELNIDEDLFSNVTSGSLVIGDSLNIITNLPVMEGDLITGKFVRKENDPYVFDFDPSDLDFTFEISHIESQEQTNQDTQVIALFFTSGQWTDNLSRRISKSFYQMSFADMVKNIYDTHLTGGGLKGELPIKPLVTSPTDGLWNIIIPNLKPFEAIEFLKKRSIAFEATNFLFWEDKDQFNFRPFSELLESDPVAEYFTSSLENFVDLKGNIDKEALKGQYLDSGKLKRTEDGYHDISRAAMEGMISNRLIRHDIFNKRVVDHRFVGANSGNYAAGDVYNYNEEFGKASHTDNNSKALIREATNNKFATENGQTIISVYPDHKWQFENQESYKSEKWLRQRRGQMSQLNFVRFEITTPGNMTRKVGEKIKINANSPQWKLKNASEGPTPDSRFSGNYIISSIKKKFTSDNFSNVMEIIRDDYVDLVTDPIWEEAAPAEFGDRTSSVGGRGGV